MFVFLGSILLFSLLNFNQLNQIKNDLILDTSLTEEALKASGVGELNGKGDFAPRVWIYGERVINTKYRFVQSIKNEFK